MLLSIPLTAPLILLLPLAGFFTLFLAGKTPFMRKSGDKIATCVMAIVWVLALNAFSGSLGNPDPNWNGLNPEKSGVNALGLRDLTPDQWVYSGWMSSPTSDGNLQAVATGAADAATRFNFSIGMLVDHLTAGMLLVVASVSFFVHLFSMGYMQGDRRYLRFFCILQIFTFAMLGLILSDNLLTLYVFWEIMGFSSYALIGHLWEKKSAQWACLKAFMTTRLGDVLMFIGLMIIWAQVGSMRFDDINAAVATGQFTTDWRFWASILVFCGAMGKSAQFPLHVWLPDAMEGPTPVSALIHAATMVAAGVYLTARCILIMTPESLMFVAYIGGFTALFAATIAVVQDDIKKVLAYSTISQLGYMMLGLGLSGNTEYGYSYGTYHLTTHAFFKACLFLGSGSIIHAMHHEQNMSKYGGLWKKMPITTVTFVAATLCLIGFPFSSGFYSKDGVIASTIEFAVINGNTTHILLPFFAVVGAAFTTFYMFRLIFLTFTGEPRDKHAYEHAHESPWTMTVPLVMLAGIAILLGFPGIGGDWFKHRNPMPELSQYAQITEGMNADKVVDPKFEPKWYPQESKKAAFLLERANDSDAEVYAFATPPTGFQAVSVALGANTEADETHESHDAPAEEHAAEAHADHAADTHAVDTHDADGHAADEHDADGHDTHAAAAATHGNGGHGDGGHADDGHGGGHGDHHSPYHEAHAIATPMSIVIVVVFISLAALFYFAPIRMFDPAKWKERNPQVWAMLWNKYYVDEFYIAVLVKPLMRICERVWKFDDAVIDGVVNASGRASLTMCDAIGEFDKNIVDGAVNKVSDSVSAWGGVMAKLQSGNIRHYLMGVVAGFAVLTVCFVLFPTELALFAGDVSHAFMGFCGLVWDWVFTPLYHLIFWFGSFAISVLGWIVSAIGLFFDAILALGAAIAGVF